MEWQLPAIAQANNNNKPLIMRLNCGTNVFVTEVFRVRLDRALLRRASKVAEEIGTSPGEVVRLMFTQMVKRRAIPFPLQADPAENEALSSAERRSKMWDAMNEGRPEAR
jgi:addiction module RelB/DinJ family antitoxin